MKSLVFFSIPPILKVDSAWGCAQGKVSKVVGSQSCFSRVKSTIITALYFVKVSFAGENGDLKIRDVQELNSIPGRAFDPGLSNS